MPPLGQKCKLPFTLAILNLSERPLHRSPALRKIFKQAAALASADGGSLRPAHLLVALIESGDPVVSAAVTKLGHDSFAVLRELRDKISRIQNQEKRKKEVRGIAEEDEVPKKKTALERFGRFDWSVCVLEIRIRPD